MTEREQGTAGSGEGQVPPPPDTSVEDALSDASGDTVKAPSEDEPLSDTPGGEGT